MVCMAESVYLLVMFSHGVRGRISVFAFSIAVLSGLIILLGLDNICEKCVLSC